MREAADLCVSDVENKLEQFEEHIDNICSLTEPKVSSDMFHGLWLVKELERRAEQKERRKYFEKQRKTWKAIENGELLE